MTLVHGANFLIILVGHKPLEHRTGETCPMRLVISEMTVVTCQAFAFHVPKHNLRHLCSPLLNLSTSVWISCSLLTCTPVVFIPINKYTDLVCLPIPPFGFVSYRHQLPKAESKKRTQLPFSVRVLKSVCSPSCELRMLLYRKRSSAHNHAHDGQERTKAQQ